ncbi:YIP1 family protein [Pseudogracilibacillus auburnensis]|uniref:YIP1 family protein n=1 Tax=Pseudogracilibacillus auburnensis TaxID=1494959 RepID=UPI001A964A32|nr:YIP1 family protein [Pseudogracilibacillus auburnensis]MBO1005133.1 YIP1 family protein [Pseudogracilibacillus auburnensis]
MSTMQMMRQILARPLDFFQDIQEPGQLKWSQAFLLILLTYMVRMGSLLMLGYHFETREPYQISYFHEFVWIFIPWITWCLANWSVSTILDGEGKFKEIFVGSAFCLMPYILLSIPLTLLTNIFALSEATIYTSSVTFIFVWVGLLILIKVKVLHDFELGKLVLITFLTLLGMAIIWFIGILLYGLINQFISFFLDLFKEVRFRL